MLPRRNARVAWYRLKVRDRCREAFLESNGDKGTALQLARMYCKEVPGEMKADKQLQGILVSIAIAVLVQLVAGWIADHINDWINRSVAVPPPSYDVKEPGYDPYFEDDES